MGEEAPHLGGKTPGRKNPLPVTNLRRGCQHTRRLETYPHGALRSREAYPSQHSSWQGLLPTRIVLPGSPRASHLRLIIIYGAQAPWCQEGITFLLAGSPRPAPSGASLWSSPAGLQPAGGLLGLLGILIAGAPEDDTARHASD